MKKTGKQAYMFVKNVKQTLNFKMNCPHCHKNELTDESLGIFTGELLKKFRCLSCGWTEEE